MDIIRVIKFSNPEFVKVRTFRTRCIGEDRPLAGAC